MSKHKYDWIRLKYDVTPNLLLCERCKKEFEMPSQYNQPLSFNMMIGIMNSFAKDHKHCKVRT